MAEHGGYRRPAHPAPVSGPGAMSKRTDGGPSDTQAPRWAPTDDYGGATELMQVQQGAPLEGGTTATPIPLTAPTMHPDEPLTAGAPFGPGPGPRGGAPALIEPPDVVAEVIRAAYAAYPSPQLGSLMDYLEAQGR